MKGFFQGLPPVFGSNRIQFQASSVVSEKAYIRPILLALFHYVNVLIKVLILLFPQMSTVYSKIVQVWP